MDISTFIMSTITTLLMALLGYVLKMMTDRMNRIERTQEAQGSLLNSVKEAVVAIKYSLEK